jgi:two-component system NtrC family response regulator
MKRILIIDDNKLFCELVSTMIFDQVEEVVCAYDLADGMEKAKKSPFDVIFLDVQLPDGNGLEFLPELKRVPSRPDVIIITAEGNRSGAKLAIENGAWDYLQKSDSADRVNLTLRRVLEYRKEKLGIKPAALKRDRVIGNSLPLKACLDLVAQAGSSDVNVLITGQTGTGKELFARTIHENSSREKGDFIVVDCAALPETLVESTLFGHEKGSFTGAERSRDGLVRLAHGGTLFLDEIGELPLSLQKPFLRVLQERRFRPVGGKKEIESDFRLIAATNRDLDQMVKSKEFREDLIYRVRAITIHLPPLSERSEDIQLLARHYLEKLYKKSDQEPATISDAFFETLEAYHWPGNIRELTHALESAYAAALGGKLLPQHLPDKIRIQAAFSELDKSSQGGVTNKGTDTPLPKFKDYRNVMTRQYIKELMIRTKGDIRSACEMSGFSRSRLYDLLKQYDIRT